MNEEKINTLVELLNKRDKEERDGAEIESLLETIFNVFGSYKRLMEDITQKLNETGKKALRLCLCMSALELAQWYLVCDCNEWDDRKKNSEICAYQEHNFFENAFTENAGFTPEYWDDEHRHKNLSSILSHKQFKENGCEYLLAYLNKWTNTHSTLKQSIFGGYVRAVLEQESDRFGRYSFPLI